MQHVQVGGRGQRGFQALGHAALVGQAGQEHEHVAGLLGQGLAHGPRHQLGQPLGRARRRARHAARTQVVGFDGVHKAGAGNHRRVKPGAEAGGVKRGRHHQQAQVGAQHRLGVEGQGQPQVGLQAALVKLVEEHRGHALQRGVVLQQAGEDALGYHFNARVPRYLAFEPHAVAHGVAHGLVEQAGHAGSGGAGGEAARFEYQDFTIEPPRGLQQRQRHHGGFARPGRRLQHGSATGRQGRQQLGQRRANG